MPKINYLNSQDEISSKDEWCDKESFKKKGELVDYQGRSYIIQTKKVLKYSKIQRAIRIIPGIFLVAITLGIALASKSVRRLFTKKTKSSEIYALLKNNGSPTVFKTKGDGSCGLHAMLGKLENGQYQCNAADYRKQFCDSFRNGEPLPKEIENVIDDYFLHPQHAPKGFSKVTQSIRDALFVDYETLPFGERDARKESFRNDPTVRSAYLDHLEKVGTHLLQDELKAMAIFFNKKVILIQPGWGDDGTLAEHALTESGEEEVVIYYNGTNHYERAIKPVENLKEIEVPEETEEVKEPEIPQETAMEEQISLPTNVEEVEEAQEYLDHQEELSHSILNAKVSTETSESLLNSWIELKDKTPSIDQFLFECANGYDRDDIMAFINSGRRYLAAIEAGNEIKASAEYIVSGIAWVLMYLAWENKEHFEEGAFVVKDENQKLKNFFENLPVGYSRLSSHLKGQQTGVHRGIDGLILPNHKTHLLVIPVEQPDGSRWLYLKPEQYGTKGFHALVGHAGEYVVSQGRKFAPIVFGSDQGEGMRKERIPDDLRKEFVSLVQELSGANKAIEEVGSKGFGEGIKAMYAFVCQMSAVDSPQKDLLIAFKTKLEEKYNHLNNRTGDEVILTDADIKRN